MLARFRREHERQRLADTYLLLGASRPRLRRLAAGMAAAYLEVHGPVEDVERHLECVVLDPDALGVPGLRVEHLAERGDGGFSLEQALRYRPGGPGRRAVLLYEADRMGPDAQAVLLKTCEEPPDGTLLFLTAGDLTPLLPALRSRCRTYRLGALPAAELAQRAAAAGLSEHEARVLAACYGGLEAALELDAEARSAHLERHRALGAWLQGASTATWLEPPQGATLAEQRAAASESLSSCLAWLVRESAQGEPGLRLRADRAVAALRDALVDLTGNITPWVVYEDLAVRLEARGLVA
ncbi:MAG: hypothetical protein EYC70_03765 [Planctomycetota bacterium]|nr:MAG: hypothetical protein EYC70_03765 [Planctomycetota bacterium]